VRLAVDIIGRANETDAPRRAELFRVLAESAELSGQPLVGNAWQNALLEAIISDDNVFARKAELGDPGEIGPSLLEQTRSDLSGLRLLFDLDMGSLLDGFSSIDGFAPRAAGPLDESRLAISPVRRGPGGVLRIERSRRVRAL
jgi:hypothetical protein